MVLKPITSLFNKLFRSKKNPASNSLVHEFLGVTRSGRVVNEAISQRESEGWTFVDWNAGIHGDDVILHFTRPR